MVADADIAGRTTLGELIHQRTGELTPSERKVARTLFATNLMAGFDTVAELARRAQVSGPTVVRFATRLGFSGYPEFQRALRGDLARRIDSPLRLYGKNTEAPRGDRLLDHARDVFTRGIAATIASMPAEAFDAVIALLVDRRRPFWTTGGRFTQFFAQMLHAHLYQLLPSSHVIEHAPAGRADALLDLGRRDVLLVFDVRRYQKDTIALAQTAAARGTTLILVTDPWLSPIADIADHVLTVDVEAPSPYDSLVPCIALVETMVAAVVASLGQSTRRRIAELERLRDGVTWDDDMSLERGEEA